MASAICSTVATRAGTQHHHCDGLIRRVWGRCLVTQVAGVRAATGRPRGRPRQDPLAVGTLVGTFVGTRPSCNAGMRDVHGNRQIVKGNSEGNRGNAQGNRGNRATCAFGFGGTLGATLRATLRAIVTATPARVEMAR